MNARSSRPRTACVTGTAGSVDAQNGSSGSTSSSADACSTRTWSARPRIAWHRRAAQYQPARPPPTMTTERTASDMTRDELRLRGHALRAGAHGRAQARGLLAHLVERDVVEPRVEALRQDALAQIDRDPARL